MVNAWCRLYTCILIICFLFKQKTSYEMRISDWSSDVFSSDLDECGAETISLYRFAVTLPPGAPMLPGASCQRTQKSRPIRIRCTRSEERRVWKVGVSTSSYWWWPCHLKENKLKVIMSKSTRTQDKLTNATDYK